MEPGNIAQIIWPLGVGVLVYSVAAARSQRGFAPLVFAAAGAYAVNWAMKNERDYLSIRARTGGRDYIPF